LTGLNTPFFAPLNHKDCGKKIKTALRLRMNASKTNLDERFNTIEHIENVLKVLGGRR